MIYNTPYLSKNQVFNRIEARNSPIVKIEETSDFNTWILFFNDGTQCNVSEDDGMYFSVFYSIAPKRLEHA